MQIPKIAYITIAMHALKGSGQETISTLKSHLEELVKNLMIHKRFKGFYNAPQRSVIYRGKTINLEKSYRPRRYNKKPHES